MADFSDAHAKLRRAEKHVADVQAQVASFLATDFYRLRIEPNQREGRVEVVFDSLHQPDKGLNLIVGDAISNLRSALDYAVVALTGHGEAQFPNADGANDFKGKVKAGLIGKTVPDAIPIFLTKIQAYQGGNGHAIWTLNKLRNIDKHRFLLTTTEVAGVTASWRTIDGSVYTDCGCGVQAGASGVFISTPANYLEFTSQPRPTFQVLIKEPPSVPNKPVLDVLQLLTQSVKVCLGDIEAIL